MPNLKPCPYCGHTPTLLHGSDGEAVVHCDGCEAETVEAYGAHAVETAIGAWNRRTPDWQELAQEAGNLLLDILFDEYTAAGRTKGRGKKIWDCLIRFRDAGAFPDVPSGVWLVGGREPTADEVAYGLTLEV